MEESTPLRKSPDLAVHQEQEISSAVCPNAAGLPVRGCASRETGDVTLSHPLKLPTASQGPLLRPKQRTANGRRRATRKYNRNSRTLLCDQLARFGAVGPRQEQLSPVAACQHLAIGRPCAVLPFDVAQPARGTAQNGETPERPPCCVLLIHYENLRPIRRQVDRKHLGRWRRNPDRLAPR